MQEVGDTSQPQVPESKPRLLNFILKTASNAFFLLGERIALVAILLIAAFLLMTQNSISVSADSKFDKPIIRPNYTVIENEKITPKPQEKLLAKNFTPTPIESTLIPTTSANPSTTPTPTKSLTPTITPTYTPVEGVDYGSLNEEEDDLGDPTITPSPTVTPTPTSAPVAKVAADPGDNAIWEKLADCESHQNWNIDTGNGYFGGLQFNQGAWNSVGGSGNPAQASKDEQIMRGKMLQSQRGWVPWSGCAKSLGLL